MDWRIKALGHWAISLLPRSEDLGYLMQRRVTRTLPMSDQLFRDQVAAADRHLALGVKHLGRPPARAYEFGAGWDLTVPLVLAARGVPHQTVTDIRRLLRPELVAESAARLGMDSNLEALGIHYLAPLDARATGLSGSTFDIVTSTDTLEHVPQTQLVPVLAECRRLLVPDGVMTAKIDYRDHYSYGDPRRGLFAFLGHGARAWRLWNPSSHFQSRLRHSDFMTAFEAAGFELVAIDHPNPRIQELGGIHPDFRRYTLTDLSIAEAWFVARPRPRAS
jgi:SAM-dependent methyltransferase